jgi:7-cyano-7-deazaguanine synthase in queuosine biosynthesis
MLDFLTGDLWNISFEKRKKMFSKEPNTDTVVASFQEVTLFSGGMDSLIETINCLEQNKKVALISHAGDGFTKSVQTKLLEHLCEKYSDKEPNYFNLWMQFEKDLIPNGGIENTTRSRSFLFIAFGIMALSGMKDVFVLQVPENGLIALNVPLDVLRVGSHSTRTTHPFYLALWNQLLNDLGLSLSVHNPYWNKTKGEMTDECLNKEFLLQVIDESISCSSPQKARWSGYSPQHCGYCVPCIIRRAAMHKAFGGNTDTTQYLVSNLAEIVSSHAQGKGVQLRSFQIAISKIKKQPSLAKLLIHKTGNLQEDSVYLSELANTYSRGLLEVDRFIQSSL